jgi:hypothetical protein
MPEPLKYDLTHQKGHSGRTLYINCLYFRTRAALFQIREPWLAPLDCWAYLMNICDQICPPAPDPVLLLPFTRQASMGSHLSKVL